MTDLTSTSTFKQGIPQLNHSSIIIETPATAATGDEIDVAAYLSEIWIVYIANASGVVQTATFSGTVITFGTLTTGTHYLFVAGVKA